MKADFDTSNKITYQFNTELSSSEIDFDYPKTNEQVSKRLIESKTGKRQGNKTTLGGLSKSLEEVHLSAEKLTLVDNEIQ